MLALSVNLCYLIGEDRGRGIVELICFGYRRQQGASICFCIREFGASRAGSYDPFRLVIWEDATQMLIKDFERSDWHGA